MTPQEFLKSSAYRTLQSEHLLRTLGLLLEEGMEFALAAELRYVEFDPPLPSELFEAFPDVTLFALAGYTLESARILQDEASSPRLIFEAGFGAENLGSVVSMPLLAIRQIFLGDLPLLVNMAKPEEQKAPPDPERSMEALLSRPENLKLIKKKNK